ncbi:nucleotidyltransferase domain-containing protein [Bacillus sp. T33-2]|uniref:nucleotidyltransferase domain-containing protein n=1 Tax=Bacillus sp. T33-2 TaxID=2054168 RepID=UPI0015E144C9|nr:nucleotidyltransferase domain-containing protein [Bacillus sp. T33-2]
MVPTIIDEFVDNYVRQLTHALSDKVICGVYIYGSIALDAFNLDKSDIDFVVLLNRELNKKEVNTLKDLHSHLNKKELGRKLDGMYLQLSSLGKNNRDLPPYPYCSKGVIKTGYWDVNSITWWVLKHHGITLYGPDISSYDFEVGWDNIVESIKYNINHYWYKKSKNKFLFLFDDMLDFSITTVSRIVCALEEKKIFSKEEAISKLLKRFPERRRLILQEAIRIRQNPNSPSHFRSRLKRAAECRDFILYARAYCNEKFFA